MFGPDPCSVVAAQFTREALEKALEGAGVRYVCLGKNSARAAPNLNVT